MTERLRKAIRREDQEYLAGAHLGSLPDFASDAVELAGDEARWREVILLAVGRLVYLGGAGGDGGLDGLARKGGVPISPGRTFSSGIEHLTGWKAATERGLACGN